MTLPQILRHQPILKITKPRALLEVVLGQKHVPQPELLSLLLQIFDDGRVGLEAGLHAALADLLVVHGIRGNAFFFDEFLDLQSI
jgi:hypothetical protein